MKKLILSLVMVFVLIAAAGCSLKSGDTIKFTSLPQPVYTQGYEVEQFKNEVKVSVNGVDFSLNNAPEGVIISGLDFNNVGSHTLVVVYNSVSVTFDYEVVAVAETVKVATAGELEDALKAKAAVIELTADITSNERFVIDYSVTIYGNGNSIVVTESEDYSRAIYIYNVDNTNVSLYDLRIAHDDEVGKETRGISLADCENLVLTIDNCSIYNERYYALNLAGSNINVTVNMKNGSTAGGYCAINVWGETNVINVMDSTLLGENVHTYHDSNAFATIVANSDNHVFNFKNVTVKASSLKGNTETLVQITANNNVFNFDGCTFEYAEVGGVQCPFAYNSGSGNEIYINGELNK